MFIQLIELSSMYRAILRTATVPSACGSIYMRFLKSGLTPIEGSNHASIYMTP
jgi:hypothetical protein